MIAVALSLAILGCGALGSIVLARRPHAALFVSLASIVLAGIICCATAVRTLLGAASPETLSVSWPLPIGSATLALDGLSAWFLLVIGAVSTAVAVYCWDYFRASIGHEAIWAATALLNILVAAMVLTVCAGDVVLFMVGWELMSLSAFLLVGFHHRDARTRHGAWMYLIATHLGTAFGVLPVFGAFTAATGSTAFAGFAGAFDPSRAAIGAIVFFLGLVGFGTKAGLMPMHVWLPEAHPVAPSPVSALMSAVVIKMGVYGLLRLITWLPPLSRACAVAVVAIAVITGVMAILYALAQRQYKRMLAYSSVENIGIIILGIGLGMLGRATHQPILTTLGFGGALLHVLNHALFKGLLFLSAGAVLRATRVDNVERLGGIARSDPVNAGLFALGCAAICGLPPLNGFVGEFLIYAGLLHGAALNSLLVAASALVGVAALALIGGLALAGFSKLYGVMFLGEPRDAQVRAHATPPFMLAGMAMLALGCIAIAVGARPLGGALSVPLAVIAAPGLDPRAYFDAVLSPLAWVSIMSLLALGAAGALVALRRRSDRPELAVERQSTWGCGYSAPTARMQYTGSSYVWKLAQGFRSLLRPRRLVTQPEGVFATQVSLKTETADAAIALGYQPTFRAVARVCERLWPLQRGRIQQYLMYIVATLLIVFAVEAWLAPFSNESPSKVQPDTALRSSAPEGSQSGGNRSP
ncbi:MAG: oxidoreductase [Planctomycetes bacterium]|nr:oxidoreductase [Planctomycetota bacterium]